MRQTKAPIAKAIDIPLAKAKPIAIDIPTISKGYRIPIIDYANQGDGVLITSGAGILMAIMDHLPQLRYAVDVSEIRNPEHHLPGWIEWMGKLANQVVIAGYFCFVDPCYLLEGLNTLDTDRFIQYLPLLSYDRGIKARTLQDLFDLSNSLVIHTIPLNQILTRFQRG